MHFDVGDVTLPDELRELIECCLGGDDRAVAALVDRFGQQVFALCYRMLGHRQDAEDVAQESLVRAVRSLNQWDSTRAFVPWLLTIAGNRCRTFLVQRRRRAMPSADVEAIADERPDVLAIRHLSEEFELALAVLRDEHRQAFVLFHRQQLSYAEIAEVLAIPLGTVRTWVHRAREELAAVLRRRGVVEDRCHALRRV